MEVGEITSGTYKYKVTSKPDAPVQTVALSGFAKGKSAFKQCSKLTTAVVGNKVTEIGTSAFYKCTSLKKMTIGTGIKKMGSHIFCHDKNLRDIVIKSSKLTKIGKHNLFN